MTRVRVDESARAMPGDVARCEACGYQIRLVEVGALDDATSIYGWRRTRGRSACLPVRDHRPDRATVERPRPGGNPRPRRRPPVRCGTIEGWRKHLKRGEPSCSACLAAKGRTL